jgi:hypothetical protein
LAALFAGAGTTKNPLNQLICSINMRVSRFGAEKYKPITSLNKPKYSWCRDPESNRNALRRGILSPVRLPIPPSRQRRTALSTILAIQANILAKFGFVTR